MEDDYCDEDYSKLADLRGGPLHTAMQNEEGQFGQWTLSVFRTSESCHLQKRTQSPVRTSCQLQQECLIYGLFVFYLQAQIPLRCLSLNCLGIPDRLAAPGWTTFLSGPVGTSLQAYCAQVRTNTCIVLEPLVSVLNSSIITASVLQLEPIVKTLSSLTIINVQWPTTIFR